MHRQALRRAHPADPPPGRERASSSAGRCGWCVRSGSRPSAGKWRRWSWRRGASTNRPCREYPTPPRGNCSAIWRKSSGSIPSSRSRWKKSISIRRARTEEEKAGKRVFMLQIIQPGLAGLMDGSVSTLAPIFAAAFATHQTRDAFLVGVAASLGAGISMAFAEALSDDGSLTGRGRPVTRGLVTGLMTAAGGFGHTLPFLIHEFPRGVCRSRGRGRDRTRHHQLGAPPLHGYAAAFVRLSGGGGRRAGVRGWNSDRQLVRFRRGDGSRAAAAGIFALKCRICAILDGLVLLRLRIR